MGPVKMLWAPGPQDSTETWGEAGSAHWRGYEARGARGPQLGDAKALILLLQMDMTTTPTQWRLKVMAVCEKEPQGLVSSW
jgi:hypothetical protein